MQICRYLQFFHQIRTLDCNSFLSKLDIKFSIRLSQFGDGLKSRLRDSSVFTEKMRRYSQIV